MKAKAEKPKLINISGLGWARLSWAGLAIMCGNSGAVYSIKGPGQW
jgi:hypothetical protein